MSAPSPAQRFVLFGLILFCLLFVVGYASRLAERARLQAVVIAEEQRITQSQQEQARLKAEHAYVQSDAYIHEQAREELGMVLPGDELVIRLEQPSLPQAGISKVGEPLVGSTSTPTWRQWLDLFLPAQPEAAGL